MKNVLLFLTLVFIAGSACAQTAVTNTGTLFLNASSDILYITGDFTNNSSSALTNNGQLYVKGNLSNAQSSMAVGTGTLYLNGTSAQAVNGTQPFKTFNLNSDNTSGITLNNNLHVNGTHTFTNGLIVTSATPNYLVYEAGSSYTGDGDLKHVNGWVKKFGSTNFTFPVGNATYERTIAMNTLSASSEFNAKYFSNTPNVNQLQSPIMNLDPSEYWSIVKVSGGTAAITMNWDNSKVTFPNWVLSQIVAAEYNGSVWTSQGGTAAGNAATTGNITSVAVSTFDLFTFGSKTFPIPLTLVNFAAKRVNDHTDILWTTVSEHNVDHFIVERSDDNSHFYSITELPARNTGNLEQYVVSDTRVITRRAYYRLHWIDIDGSEKFSKTAVVNVGAAESKMQLLTNPVSERITLSVTGHSTSAFHYTINNMSGQMVQTGALIIGNDGNYDVLLNRKPQPGMYTISLKNENYFYSYKFIIQ